MDILGRNSLVGVVALGAIGLGALFVAPTGAKAAIMSLSSSLHGFAWDDGSPLDGLGDGSNANTVQIGNFANCHPFPCARIEDRGLIEYDFSSLPVSAYTVNSATLKLFRTNSDLEQQRTFDVYGYTGNNLLQNSDYELPAAVPPPAAFLGSFVYENPLVSGVEINFTVDLAFIVAQQVAGSFAGFQIRWGALESDGQRFLQLGSLGVNPNQFPLLELDVTAVPIPAALPLLASAIIGFLVVGYRRRTQSVAA